MTDEFLSERVRAEDIILGSLGFGEEAVIVSIERTSAGYRGQGKWADGELFEFENEEQLGELEVWALNTLLGILTKPVAA